MTNERLIDLVIGFWLLWTAGFIIAAFYFDNMWLLLPAVAAIIFALAG